MNPISWFEVPVADMERAIAFYNAVFGWDLELQDFGGLQMAWFPMDAESYGAGGSLVRHEAYTPQSDGVLVYFSCDEVSEALRKVASAGGKIIEEKKHISEENGYMGLALDSEGNRIALHSYK